MKTQFTCLPKSLFLCIACMLVALCTFAQNWIPQGIGLLPFGYVVKNISAVNEDVVWISANFVFDAQYPNKIFRSIDGGETWEVIDVNVRPDCHIADLRAINASTAWMTIQVDSHTGTFGELYKTEDGGQSWELKLTDPAAKGYLHVFDDEHIACRFNASHRWTEDGGETWEYGSIWGYPDFYLSSANSTGGDAVVGDTAWMGMVGNDVAYDYTRARLIRATGYGQNIISIDTRLDSVGSIEFISFTDHLNGLMKFNSWHKITEMDYYYGWITYFNKPEAALARTTDGGETWERIHPPTSEVLDISAVPGSRNSYVLVGPKKIYWTTDAGETWATDSVSHHICCMEFSSPTAGWAAIHGTAANDPLVLKWNGDFPSGTKDYFKMANTELSVYPNPALEVVHYTLEGDDLQHHTVTLTDATGKVVFVRTSQQQEINIDRLPEGIYFLKVMTMDFSGIAKIVISRN